MRTTAYILPVQSELCCTSPPFANQWPPDNCQLARRRGQLQYSAYVPTRLDSHCTCCCCKGDTICGHLCTVGWGFSLPAADQLVAKFRRSTAEGINTVANRDSCTAHMCSCTLACSMEHCAHRLCLCTHDGKRVLQLQCSLRAQRLHGVSSSRI